MRTSIGVTSLLLVVAVHTANAQTLGERARGEAERRASLRAPARVLTNDDLSSTTQLTVSRVLPATPPVVDGPRRARRVPVAPATLQRGSLPLIPVRAVGGGEVILEAAVDEEGRVTAVKTLRDTPPFTQEMTAAVRGWLFQPAEDAEVATSGGDIVPGSRRPVDSSVMVIGLFRPPSLFLNTLGQPPRDVAAPSDEVPALAALPPLPPYPPRALFDGTVLTELNVGATGAVLGAKVLRSSPGLDEPTLSLLPQLAFRPARMHGVTAPAMVYMVTGFRQPVTFGTSTQP